MKYIHYISFNFSINSMENLIYNTVAINDNIVLDIEEIILTLERDRNLIEKNY